MMTRSFCPLPSRTTISRALKVHVLHTQADAFHQTHPRAIKQVRHEQMRPRHMQKHPSNLATGEDNGEALRHLGLGDVCQPVEFHAEDLAVEKEQCRLRLILRRGGDMPIYTREDSVQRLRT